MNLHLKKNEPAFKKNTLAFEKNTPLFIPAFERIRLDTLLRSSAVFEERRQMRSNTFRFVLQKMWFYICTRTTSYLVYNYCNEDHTNLQYNTLSFFNNLFFVLLQFILLKVQHPRTHIGKHQWPKYTDYEIYISVSFHN